MKQVMALLLAGAGVGTIFAAPAHATGAGSADAVAQSRIDTEIASILDTTSGARRISATQVEMAPGVRRTYQPADFGGTAARTAECGPGYLCIWREPGFRGSRTEFYKCGTYDLRDFGNVPRDTMSSAINNQVRATARFFDYDGGGQLKSVYVMGDNTRLQDMRYDKANDGRTLDNRVDIIKPC